MGKVLLVVFGSNVRGFLNDLLERLGYEVVGSVETHAEARQQFSRELSGGATYYITTGEAPPSLYGFVPYKDPFQFLIGQSLLTFQVYRRRGAR